VCTIHTHGGLATLVFSIAVEPGLSASEIPDELSFFGEDLGSDRLVLTPPEPSQSDEYQEAYRRSQMVLEVDTITKLFKAKGNSLFADLSKDQGAYDRIRREYSAYADNLIRNSSPEIHDALNFNKKLIAETVSNTVITQKRETEFKADGEKLTQKAEESTKNVFDNYKNLSGKPGFNDFLETDYAFKVKQIEDSVYFIGEKEKNRLLSNIRIAKNAGTFISEISNMPLVDQLKRISDYQGGETVEENLQIKTKVKEHFNLAREKDKADKANKILVRDKSMSEIRLWWARNPNASIEEIENQFTSRGLDIYDSHVSKQLSAMVSKAVGDTNTEIEKRQEARDKIAVNNLVNQLKNTDMFVSPEEINDALDLYKNDGELYNKITNALTERYLKDVKTVEEQDEENTKILITANFRNGIWTSDTFAQWQISEKPYWREFAQKYRTHIISVINELKQRGSGSSGLGSNVKGAKNWTANFLKNWHKDLGLPFDVKEFTFTPEMEHHPDLMYDLARQIDYTENSYAFKQMQEFFQDWESHVEDPKRAERIIAAWENLTSIKSYNGVFSKIITKNEINEIKRLLQTNKVPGTEGVKVIGNAEIDTTEYDKQYSNKAAEMFKMRPTKEQEQRNVSVDNFVSQNSGVVVNAFKTAFSNISDNTSMLDRYMTKEYGRRWSVHLDKMLESNQTTVFDTDQLSYSAIDLSGKNQLMEYFRAELKRYPAINDSNIAKAASEAILRLAIDGWGPSNYSFPVDPNNPGLGKQIVKNPIEKTAAQHQVPHNILVQHILIAALPDIKKEAEKKGLVDVRAVDELYATNPKFNPSYLKEQLNALNPNWGWLVGDGTFQKAIDQGNILIARDDRFPDRDVFQIRLRFADDDEWLHVPLQQVDVKDIASVLFNKYGPGTMPYMLNNVWDATWDTRELNQVKTLVENRLKGQEGEGVSGFQTGETKTALKQPNNIPLSDVEVALEERTNAPAKRPPLRPPYTAVSSQKETQNIFDSVVKAEGFREAPYDDGGSKSIGYGFKIRDIEPDERKLIKNINKVTKEESKNVLSLKIKKMISKFDNDLKDFRDLTINRKKALVHMAFQLGYDNITDKPGGKKGKRWSNFWSFVKDGKWNLASSAIVKSKYYEDAKAAAKRKVNRKAGLLKRANQNIQWIRKG
jgi:GH24 family phage-related lysozyme (muramidase)